jgi:hypothetical protein
MYRCYLQCDEHVFAGTLMYLHWNLPVDRLCLLLSKFCGYNISARFKALDVGRRDENSLLIRSLHVECSAKDKAKVQKFLEAYYNMQSPRTFILGIKLRFIPLLHETGSIGGHDKTMRFYNRQAEFNKMLQWSNIFFLTDAHIIDSRSKRSINDCIMALKVVSTPLLNQMRQRGFGFFYPTCMSNEELQFVGYSFINDTDTIQSEQDT